MTPAAGGRLLAAVLALALAQPIDAAPRRPPSPKTCLAEAGPRVADDLSRDCRTVIDAPGACRSERPCEAIREDIARACAEAAADAPPLCEAYGVTAGEEVDE